MMIVFWGGLFWVIATLSRDRNRPVEQSGSAAQDIAARRFAAGEIDEAEFGRITQRLGHR